jgi:Flp pilus assembly protein TadD
MKLLLLAAFALTGVSCVSHTTRVVRTFPTPAPRPQTTTFERQIQNAHDAGDGDYHLGVLRQTVAANPNDIGARLQLAAAYRERGYAEIALEICRLAAARFPASGEVQLALVRALRDLNLRNEAIASLEAFLQAHPQTSPDYFSWMGILRDETGQWTAGEPSHRMAVELAPGVDSLHNNLGYNLLMQKKNAEAAGEFREALRLNPASQVARNNLGLALAEQNSNAEAVANWQSGADPATAHNNLAAVLMEKGNYAGARTELELALGYNKAHSAALKNMELVSRLDGQAATLPATVNEASRWVRWKTGFVRLFVGPLDDSRKAAKTAAPSETREEQ